MADGEHHGTGDGAQDPCSFFAAFIDQRIQIERLLSWLRESQTACTDTNCFDDINGLVGSEHGGALATDTDDYNDSSFESSPIAMVLCLVLTVLTVYAIGLNSNRRAAEAALPAKSNQSGTGPDDDDHAPFRRRNNGDDQGRPAI